MRAALTAVLLCTVCFANAVQYLADPSFENAAGIWRNDGSGYSTSTAVVEDGSQSIKMSTTSLSLPYGAYQIVTINQTVAAPLLLSGWSKSTSMIVGTNVEDYAVYASVLYKNATSYVFAAYASFPKGAADTDWVYSSTTFWPSKPVQAMEVYARFRYHSGTVYFDNFALELAPPTSAPTKKPATSPPSPKPATPNPSPTPSAMPGTTPTPTPPPTPKPATSPPVTTPVQYLVDTSFENPSGVWLKYGPGYSISTTVVKDGTHSIEISTSSVNLEYGAYQIVTINQTAAKPLKLSGWSKSTSTIVGTINTDYSIYLNVEYQGSSSFAYATAAPFPKGTADADWVYASATFYPTQPIKSVQVYAMFRYHSGTVYFDNFALETLVPTAAPTAAAATTAPTQNA